MSSARILFRTGGLGDVVMALAAAQAMKALTGDQILLVTSRAFGDIARACPHVDHVLHIESLSPLEQRAIDLGQRLRRFYDLNPVAFGLAREHQVDAYLWAAGLEAPAAQKQIQLVLPGAVVQRTRAKARRAGVRERSVVLHPAVGDPNRTWPQERWTELARLLGERGYPVVLIGATDRHKGAQPLPDCGAISLIGHLDALETVALLRDSLALITTDSGPVQLAGATEAAIVGIYSVVRGRNRLPFRHGQPGWNAIAIEPDCPSFGCYRHLNRPEVAAPLLEAVVGGRASLAQALGEWCVQPESQYACLRSRVRPDAVMTALLDLLERADRDAAARRAPADCSQGGAPPAAPTSRCAGVALLTEDLTVR